MGGEKTRLIARLDVKAPNLVKGIQLEGLRKLGDPHDFAVDYYRQGIDELLYMDIVASLYNRNNLSDIVRRTTGDVFIPITVGGGVRTIDDIRAILRAGADKVSLNSAAVHNPQLIAEGAKVFGRQCIVTAIDAKRRGSGYWEVFTAGGRQPEGLDAIGWAMKAEELGAGEILLTSMDRDGTKSGYDLELTSRISSKVNIPVIASGGAGDYVHFLDAFTKGEADAVLAASLFHYNEIPIPKLKKYLRKNGISVRI